MADAAALENLKTLRRAKQAAPRGSGGPNPPPATATSGRSGVSFAVDSARDPERAARIAKSSAMTGMPARLLSRVTPLVTPFERVAEDQATHLRLLSRDARRRDAERGDGEGAGKGERWIMDANDALTAWAAASALEEASAASEARLTRALAEASEEQLRALEAAARAARARGPAGDAVKNDAVKKDAAEISTETSVRSEKGTHACILRRRDSSRGGHGRFRVGTETHAETDVGLGDRIGAPPFSVDAALARFDPAARAPQRLSARTRSSRRRNPPPPRRRGSDRARTRALLRLVQGGHAGGHRVAEQERRLGGPGGGRRAARSVRGASSEGLRRVLSLAR